MNSFTTQGIVLARTDFGEADRIVTFLTPARGKVKAMVRGARKPKSKLSGGIELFSVSDISLIIGRGEINTLISSRLSRHFGDIVKDLDRTNLAYELLKRINKATEDAPEETYFRLMEQGLVALDSSNIDLTLIDVWFNAQLLKLAGHAPDLRAVQGGQKLAAGRTYDFDFDAMSFKLGQAFNTDQIKFMRLLFSGNPVATLQKVRGADGLAAVLRPLIQSIFSNFIRM